SQVCSLERPVWQPWNRRSVADARVEGLGTHRAKECTETLVCEMKGYLARPPFGEQAVVVGEADNRRRSQPEAEVSRVAQAPLRRAYIPHLAVGRVLGQQLGRPIVATLVHDNDLCQ